MATIEELTAKVAKLEQQMAAITAPPTEYYTSAYSGEEIDAAVKKVSEGLAGGVTSFNGPRPGTTLRLWLGRLQRKTIPIIRGAIIA